MLWELLKGFPSVHKALTYIDAIGCALALEKPAAREQTLILPVTAHSRPPQDNDLEEARRHIAELKALLAQADDELEEKSRAVDQSARAVARLEVQLREANTTAAEDMEEALQALDDVERSRAEAEELRRRLFEAGRYEDAVVEHPPGAPTSFAELWDRFSGLQRVLVTADKNKTLQLDRAERGRVWAAKAWNALMALDSYAEVASQGFSGRFREYCMAGIAGSVIWPVKQLALGEAEVTMAKFGAERIFAVPQSVDPSGRRQMKSHLRLDSKGAISPRIYFLDDTKGTTARVIVGYIGPHLTNTKT